MASKRTTPVPGAKSQREKRARATAGRAAPTSTALTVPPSAETGSAKPVDYDVPGPECLSRALADKLIEARQTMPRRFAAFSCGVSPKTFERWLQIGASTAHDPVCIYLACRVHQLEGLDVSSTVNELQRLRAVSPAAAELYLKIMHPADFGGHVRTVPDEFEGQERNRQAQDSLLASPPPRMMAKMRQYRWLQVPEGATPEEMAAVEAVITGIRSRLAAAVALPPTVETQGQESGQ